MSEHDNSPEPDEPDLAEEPEPFDLPLLPEPPRPINWNLLSSDQAEAEWLDLNAWVNWLRRTYGLSASIVPPFWHRHPELVWELSALHLHWLAAYDPDQHASAPLGWHRDFADTRQRLRDWVTTSGTRLDRDRPLRQTSWPGEAPTEPVEDVPIAHRDDDFVQFVLDDVRARRRAEDAFYASAPAQKGNSSRPT